MQWANGEWAVVIGKKDRPFRLLCRFDESIRLIDSSSIEHKDGSPLSSSFTQKEEDIQHLFIVDLINLVTMYTWNLTKHFILLSRNSYAGCYELLLPTFLRH